MEALPRVAALLPAWNSSSFITQTLESLQAQTYSNLEVQIFDDSSTDNTAQICAGFVADGMEAGAGLSHYWWAMALRSF